MRRVLFRVVQEVATVPDRVRGAVPSHSVRGPRHAPQVVPAELGMDVRFLRSKRGRAQFGGDWPHDEDDAHPGEVLREERGG